MAYTTVDVAVQGSSIMTSVPNRGGTNFNDASGRNYKMTISKDGVKESTFAFGVDAIVVFTFTNPTVAGVTPNNQGYAAHNEELGPNSTLAKMTVYLNRADYDAGKASYSYSPQNPINSNGGGGGNISNSEQGTGDLYLAFQTNVFSQSSTQQRLNGYTGPIPAVGNEFFIMPSVNLHEELVVKKQNVTVNRVSSFDHDRDGSISGDDRGNGFFTAGGLNRYVDPPAPICFAAGTLIETNRGPVAVEKLQLGDFIVTADHGLQPLVWIGKRSLSAQDLAQKQKFCPIVVKAGALGEGLPQNDLRVSPQHRLMLRSQITERMYGEKEILVAAKHLVNDTTIYVEDTCKGVEYFHLLFDTHEVVFANGAPAESLYTGPMALKMLPDAALSEVLELFPELRDRDYTPPAARLFAQGAKARKLSERHYANSKALYAA